MINSGYIEEEINNSEIPSTLQDNKSNANEKTHADKHEECEFKEIVLTNNKQNDDSDKEKKTSENVQEENKSKEKIGWSSLNITIEPIRFMVPFITSFTNGLIIDLMELNVCKQKFNFTFDQCKDNVTEEMKTSLQSDLATVAMFNDLVKGIFPVALVLFLGSWTDKNGRIPWLLWSIRGFILTHLLWLIISMLPSVPLICFVIPSIPYSLSGGMITINICTWSYICDIHSATERPFRFSIFSMVALVGILAGNLMAAEVFYFSGKYGYQVVFSITTLIAIATLIYTKYAVKETVIVPKGKETKLFNFDNVKSVFVAVLIKPKGGLLKTLAILMTLTMEISARTGDDHLAYLVGKSEYSWKLRDYNFFSSLTFFIQAMVPVPAVWILQDKLKLHNHVIIVTAGVLMFSSELIRGLASSEKVFWIASCFLVSSALIGPNIDTELSKCVSENNLGKACALVSLVDAMAPLVTIPIYTRLYQYLLPLGQTLQTYLLSAAMSIVLISTAMTLCVSYRLEMKKLLIFRDKEELNQSELKSKDNSAESAI